MALFAWNITSLAQKPGVVVGNEPGWQKIGETVASFKSQNESIAVLGSDEFAAIKIRVEDATLQIERLQVFYESGDMQEIDVKKKIKSGGESKAYRLDHPDRDIQKVAFTYSTEANAEGDKADVVLLGLKSGQEGRDSKAYRDDVERKADETGDAVSEGAAKVAAEIDDPRHPEKVGPNGQTIYIGDDSRLYYISEEGKRVYVNKTQLKDKPEDN